MGVDPVGLSLQIGRKSRARLIGEVEAIELRVALEGADRRLEGSGGAVCRADVYEAFDGRRHCIEDVDRTDISKVEASGAGPIDAAVEISVGCIVQRGDWIRHISSQGDNGPRLL